MRRGTNTGGYTITEVMIFLAISGLMFILAAAFISGKQAKNEFKQGMNDINTQVQQTINDVSNGFYPSPGDFVCSAGASGAPTFSGGTPVEQGGKQGCVFIGKVIQFGATDITPAPSLSSITSYYTYTVVGRQFQAAALGTDPHSLIPPASFNDAQPVAATSGPDLTQRNSLEWGLTVSEMYEQDTPSSAPVEIGAVGFFSGFAVAAGSTLNSGAAAAIAVAIPGSALGQGEADMAGQVANLASASITSNPIITICFGGAGVNEYGMLTIGSSQGQRLSTNMQISVGAPAEIGTSGIKCPSS